jgi:hypothetical protein
MIDRNGTELRRGDPVIYYAAFDQGQQSATLLGETEAGEAIIQFDRGATAFVGQLDADGRLLPSDPQMPFATPVETVEYAGNDKDRGRFA